MEKKNIKIYIISAIILLIVSIYYINNKPLTTVNNTVKKDDQSLEEEETHTSNIIESISYSSKDLKGNEYRIFANSGEIDLVDSDVIYLTEVKAYIILVNKPDIISITSNFGKYNTSNFDTIFSKNVNINYIDNLITGEYMEYSMQNNILIISKNVVYKNLENTLNADVIELDTLTKNTKIFMHNTKNKVRVQSIK